MKLEREIAFLVEAPLWEVWAFLRDVHAVCTCIPGVEQVVLVDDRTAELTVKEPVGGVPRVSALRVSIVAEDPPHGLRAAAIARHLAIEFDVTLQQAGSGTRLLGLIRARDTGPRERVVDGLFERRVSERTAQFAARLEQRFGTSSHEHDVSSQPALPAPRGIAGIGARLRALWRRLSG